jgi:hypothetical protein
MHAANAEDPRSLNKEFLHQIAIDRINERKAHQNVFALTDQITERINSAVNLGPRERDFCFKYVMEPRTVQQWAVYYGTPTATIRNWLNRYEIRKTIEDIQYDIRKYMVGMSVYLLREAFNQQLRILKMPEFADGPILEVKRKVVENIQAMAGVKREDVRDGKSTQTNILNFMNVGGGEPKTDDDSDVQIEATEEDVKQIEESIEELNQLSKLHQAAKSRKNDVKKISDNRGYSDEITEDIGVPKGI